MSVDNLLSMMKAPPDGTSKDALLMRLMRAIVKNDSQEAASLVAKSPTLAREYLEVGAARHGAVGFFFKEIGHYLYAGDTPLHAAAAGYRRDIAQNLIKNGAHTGATNRRGATPLHYAADGGPGSAHWNPEAQAEMIALLIQAKADPNALDKSGVAPLHRAVRGRCLAAVESLLRNGANIRLKNKNESTPLHLAVQNTGRGGSGSPESKALQKEIIGLLLKSGADPKDRDGSGKTVRQCIRSEWIEELF